MEVWPGADAVARCKPSVFQVREYIGDTTATGSKLLSQNNTSGYAPCVTTPNPSVKSDADIAFELADKARKIAGVSAPRSATTCGRTPESTPNTPAKHSVVYPDDPVKQKAYEMGLVGPPWDENGTSH